MAIGKNAEREYLYASKESPTEDAANTETMETNNALMRELIQEVASSGVEHTTMQMQYHATLKSPHVQDSRNSDQNLPDKTIVSSTTHSQENVAQTEP